jgi:transient receptor potential cation channel subfamily A protein 1
MQDVEVFQIKSLLLNIIVMTLGEIEFNDIFLEKNLEPFDFDVRLILFIFLFLMPIVLMNLLIGVAVGDIEKVQRNAYLKRIGLQVDLMYNIENNMPKFVQREVHVKRAVVKPNEGTSSFFQKVTWFLFGSSRKVQFIDAGDKDKVTSRLEVLTDKMRSQHSSLKSMQLILQQQSTVLSQIAEKLDVAVPTGHQVLQHRPSIIPPESIAVIHAPVPDTLPVTGTVPTGIERIRQRSVRVAVDKSERPRSTVL